MRVPAVLSDQQEWYLCYGARDDDDAFADEAAVLAAWQQHRESILARYQSARRPWAWRIFDRPDVPWHGYDHERSALWRAGDVLSREEQTALEAEWRQHFERAQSPTFFHCLGPGRFLTGEEAKPAHYAWADIPSELIRRWARHEPRSRKKTEPEAETAATGSDQST